MIPAGSANSICNFELAIDDFSFAALAQLERGAPLRTERLRVQILHAVPICLSRCRARMAWQGDKLAGDPIASLDAPNASTISPT